MNLSQKLKVLSFKLKHRGPKKTPPTAFELLELIHKYSLEETYPNTNVALRLFLTIPVTVASNERSFSKLELIKNYLRSTMGQERLSNMAIISIKSKIAAKLSYDKLIDDFAFIKARKVPL